MATIANQIAEKLLQINAIKLNPQSPFTWASGIKSPIYCDNRIALSYPDVRTLICEAFADIIDDFGSYDKIAGVATAGIPHGAILAQKLDKSFCYIRSKAKAHGRQNQIEGVLNAGDKVILVEDLISTGGSVLKAAEAVKENGAEVLGILAIFTYGFDQAKEAFAEKNIPYKTILDYNQLIELALERSYIKTEDNELLLRWRKDPKSWG